MSKSSTTGVRIGAVLLLALGWVVGCAAEEEAGELGVAGFTDATPADLTHKVFRFGPDAGLFPEEDPRFGQPATLFVGELGSAGSKAGFALSADDGSLQGASCNSGPAISLLRSFNRRAKSR